MKLTKGSRSSTLFQNEPVLEQGVFLREINTRDWSSVNQKVGNGEPTLMRMNLMRGLNNGGNLALRVLYGLDGNPEVEIV